jgi:hypothetical protein
MLVVLGGGGGGGVLAQTGQLASVGTGCFPIGVGTSYRDTTASDVRKFYYRSYGPSLQ